MSIHAKHFIWVENISSFIHSSILFYKQIKTYSLPSSYSRDLSMTNNSIQKYTPYQAQFLAHLLTLEGKAEDTISRSLKSSRVDMNPHQVEAALFALRSPLSKGVILADEVGLGKTIEASLVLAQRWAERKRKLILIVPASLRKQWSQELADKFSLPSFILEKKSFDAAKKTGSPNPFEVKDQIVICSYQFAFGKAAEIKSVDWDCVVFDEAHKLRNVYKKDGSITAKKLREAVMDKPKILLTATPLQNDVMELYGLVSVIDENFFGGEAAYRLQYKTIKNITSLNDLRSRLKTICQRTLRKDVSDAGLIPFRARYCISHDFTPSAEEKALYDQVSTFLQREDTAAVGKNGRQLITLVVRKILASSSFAIGDTLKRMIERLESNLGVDTSSLDDFDIVDETAEELEVEDFGGNSEGDQKAKLKAEINELKEMRHLAQGIRENAKGDALVRALKEALKNIVKKHGQPKAVIFTESVRTQTFLKELLTANGYDGKLVLLNGSNTDPDSQRIYRDWVEKQKGTNRLSGSKTADMKAAIVEAFRDTGTILIATESGAEGINLQFCSLVINYDLPWNPQRVEQRIGRCHRYGQQIDVAVVNFINKGNRADERVFQLLNDKFKLFNGVFGSSDEVLGAIESGVDIEQKINAIYQKCRTPDEFDRAFDALQNELSESITAREKETRQALLENVDESVVQKLKGRKEALIEKLTQFERQLMTFTWAELPNALRINDKRFELDGKIYSIEWPEADAKGWQFYRLGQEDDLAEQLITRAKERSLAPATIRFDYSAYNGDGQFSDLLPYRGQAGYMSATKMTVQNAVETTEHLLLCGVTDGEEPFDDIQIRRLLMIPAEVLGPISSAIPTDELSRQRKQLESDFLLSAEEQNLNFLNEESDKLDRWADESEVAFNEEIKELRKQANEFDRQARNPVLPLQEKLELKRKASHIKGEATKKKAAYFQEQERIQEDRMKILDRIESQLAIQYNIQELFTIRWELV
jgi:superfamily II DNA/RNA helicase